MKPLRYAIAGLSIRGIYAFLFPILGRASSFGDDDYSDIADLVAVIDPDSNRIANFFKTVNRNFPAYAPDEFEKALSEHAVDRVIVTGPDHTHYTYITTALKAGRDVITEKPMVTTSNQARSALEAEMSSARRIFVTHNYRYMPLLQEVKRILRAGRIGRVTNMECTYNLDTFHGASYFFRWNRERKNSGGLNIHKCCHHFDVANWLIDDNPELVSAFGKLNYYGPRGANRPLDERGHPLPPIEEKEKCPYFQRHFAGTYQADSNDIGTGWDEFRIAYDYQYPPDQRRYIYDDVIDIEDTYGAIVQYRHGAILTYSCNFSTPWEGFVIGINGTRGRIELSHRSDPDPTGKVSAPPKDERIVIYPLFGGREEVWVSTPKGGHGGADPLMRRDIFRGPSEESRALGLMASSHQGAIAIATGEAVELSLKQKRMISLKDLLGEYYNC